MKNAIHFLHDPLKLSVQEQLEFKLIESSPNYSRLIPTPYTDNDAILALENTKSKNSKTQDKARIFLDFIEGNVFNVLTGYYRHFLLSKNKAESIIKDPSASENDILPYLNSGMSILGNGILFETADNYFVVELRSKNIEQAKGRYHIIAGGVILPDSLEDITVDELNRLPFKSAKHKIQTETGVKTQDIGPVGYLGTIRDIPDAMNPSMIFYSQCYLSRKQIMEDFKSSQDKYESEKLLFLPNHKSAIESILKDKFCNGIDPSKNSSLLGTSIGALLLYGKIDFGDKWFENAVSSLKDRYDIKI
jgi:hypothetical protein